MIASNLIFIPDSEITEHFEHPNSLAINEFGDDPFFGGIGFLTGGSMGESG